MDLPRNTLLRKISVTRIVKLKLLTFKSSFLAEVNDHEFCLLKLKSIERVSAVLYLQEIFWFLGFFAFLENVYSLVEF